jgi:hypothetical protein
MKSVVCDGNSITEGVGGTAYATQLRALFLAQGQDIPVTNVGVAGKTTQNLIDTFSTKTAPYYQPGAELVFFEQYNEFNPFNGNSSVAAEQTRVHTYVSQAQAAGFKVWICSPPPTIDSPIDAKIQTYSAWLRQNHSFAYGFIDFNAMAEFYPPGWIDNPTYFSDSVHLTTLAHHLMAQTVLDAMNRRHPYGSVIYGEFMRDLLGGVVQAEALVEVRDGNGGVKLEYDEPNG